MAAKPKVVVAMSGGVDSSVAAALLLEQGYDVMGCFMRLGTPPEVAEAQACSTKPGKQGCCSVLDANDARRVAGLLGIPFYVLNFSDAFEKVIDYFVGEYNRGRTPNPCVRCNDWLKYGRLKQYAEAVGAEFVASGHYARVGTDPVSGERCLMRGIDTAKDQSYVLFGTDRDTLDRTLLPIGGFTKPEIRAMAEERDLPVFSKPDSQEICFVPDQNYAGLVERRTGAFEEGDVVDTAGNVLGQHAGYQKYTIGQRKGLRLAVGKPVYVTSIDPQSNRVVVGERADLLSTGLVADQCNLIARRAIDAWHPMPCQAQIRYNAEPVEATMQRTGDDKVEVRFATPQSAVSPGQAVCLYDSEVVLGGGWIERGEPRR
ncbi:MAG: tRNA 2-thiouridine(34) synthase MnmA [Planctomycetota bacterium]